MGGHGSWAAGVAVGLIRAVGWGRGNHKSWAAELGEGRTVVAHWSLLGGRDRVLRFEAVTACELLRDHPRTDDVGSQFQGRPDFAVRHRDPQEFAPLVGRPDQQELAIRHELGIRQGTDAQESETLTGKTGIHSP